MNMFWWLLQSFLRLGNKVFSPFAREGGRGGKSVTLLSCLAGFVAVVINYVNNVGGRAERERERDIVSGSGSGNLPES